MTFLLFFLLDLFHFFRFCQWGHAMHSNDGPFIITTKNVSDAAWRHVVGLKAEEATESMIWDCQQRYKAKLFLILFNT
jgi:hypothetical protein